MFHGILSQHFANQAFSSFCLHRGDFFHFQIQMSHLWHFHRNELIMYCFMHVILFLTAYKCQLSQIKCLIRWNQSTTCCIFIDLPNSINHTPQSQMLPTLRPVGYAPQTPHLEATGPPSQRWHMPQRSKEQCTDPEYVDPPQSSCHLELTMIGIVKFRVKENYIYLNSYWGQCCR